MSKSLMEYAAMGSSELAKMIDRELPEHEVGQFYKWLDEKMGMKFTTACNVAEDEIVAAQKEGNYNKAKLAFAEWAKQILDNVDQYRKEKKLDETRIFLDSLLK